jgi:peptidoglycan/xylan/chitin deacetylase (PgdA/CDA1 family)
MVIVIAALATLGLAAFGVIAAQKASEHGSPVALAKATPQATPQPHPAADPVHDAVDEVAPAAKPPGPVAAAEPSASSPAMTPSPSPAPSPATAAPERVGQTSTTGQSAPGAPPSAPAAGSSHAAATETGAGGGNAIKGCDKPGALGLSRVVEIDTTGGPAFGFEHFKQYDFLRDHEVVLTFDDGPWPVNTPAVVKALTDECAKATFFEIGEHATWHPEISKMVAAAGMTVASHTWSHKDLARNPYADNIEQAKQEIELGVSAVHWAVDGPIAPFFRFPDLQQPPVLLSYLGQRNIATFSTDIDSFDFRMHRPQQVVESVISKLKKRGKGIVLMHDFQRATSEALPEILRQLKANGFRLVHMVPRAPVTTVAKYDEMFRQQNKMDVTNTRPESSVVRTIGGK